MITSRILAKHIMWKIFAKKRPHLIWAQRTKEKLAEIQVKFDVSEYSIIKESCKHKMPHDKKFLKAFMKMLMLWRHKILMQQCPCVVDKMAKKLTPRVILYKPKIMVLLARELEIEKEDLNFIVTGQFLLKEAMISSNLPGGIVASRPHNNKAFILTLKTFFPRPIIKQFIAPDLKELIKKAKLAAPTPETYLNKF